MQLKYILRKLSKAPLFTVLTVLTIAIGIGANTAIFSVINGVLIKPLPYPNAGELIALDHRAPGVNIQHLGMAPFLYFTYREQNRSFEKVAMWTDDAVTVTGRSEPERIYCLDVTFDALPMLGVHPLLGHLFTASEDSAGQPETVILSYGYWQAKFGGRRSAVGERIVLYGRAREVIGVLPQSFTFLDKKAMLFLPFQLDRNKVFLGNFSFHGMARLKAGTTIASANADLQRMLPIAMGSFPPFPGYTRAMFEQSRLAPETRLLKDDLLGDIGKLLWVLMATIGMVLLIACANVANLLLVRADGRQHELAVRAALGAGWARIARELLLESITIGLLGGAVGLPLAYAGLKLLLAKAPASLPRIDEIAIDLPVLLFTLLISLFAGLLFGIVPVLKYAGPTLGTTLRAAGRTLSQSKERHRARNTLVVVQFTLALVLLVSSGLMIRTFLALRHVQPGFTDPEKLLTLGISISDTQVQDPTQVIRLEQRVLDRIASIPGVESVGITTVVPTDPNGEHDPVFGEDIPTREGKMPPVRRYKFVSPGLLKTMGNTLLAGRDFDWNDIYSKRPVAMLSESLARDLWHTPSAAIGKRVRENLTGPWREVVGVVNDERDDGIDQQAPATVIWPILMANFGNDKIAAQRYVRIMIRSNRTGSSGFTADVRKAVWSANASIPLENVQSMQEIYSKSLARTSFTLTMLAIAGSMALLLGVIGIYGVISYSVTQRTRELGIRMALGAQKQDLSRMFVVHGLRLALAGVVCGVAAAAGLMRLMSSLLFEVSPVDPVTYAVVSACLVAAAVVASYVPALRVAAVDPADALRTE